VRQRRILYLSHGGGPLPLLGDEAHTEMVSCLKSLAGSIGTPQAIVVVSAHWEADEVTITSGATPPLIYDYYGFPKESYEIRYPCPGAPELAKKIAGATSAAGIPTRLDPERGFDHGVFVPLKIMYPQADIPCAQVSLLSSLDAAEHLRLGAALREIEGDSLLVVGSGFSFHNMHAFFSPASPDSRAMNESFESWLLDTLSDARIDERERARRLASWELAPNARYCHPREEHLLPLHVCYGLAGTACPQPLELTIFHKKASMYLW